MNMVYKRLVSFFLIIGLSAVSGAGAPKDYPIKAVPFSQVQVQDNFWSRRLETNWKVSLPHVFEQCEETGRISNFAVAGGLKEGEFDGTYFNDSDVYKIIEGAAVIPEIAGEAAAILATFGCSDSAVLDVLFGKFKPTGKLPIERIKSFCVVEPA